MKKNPELFEKPYITTSYFVLSNCIGDQKVNEKSEGKSSSLQFLKTDGGKTKSNSIEVPSISLPKGGGAIKGIDEKFSVNAVNGTASFSIVLPFSAAPGSSPAVSISYNSGAGNGIFGLGWNLSLASIKHKTDKGLPQYVDAIDSDTYLFSEAEGLVPEFKINGQFIQLSGEYVISEKLSRNSKRYAHYSFDQIYADDVSPNLLAMLMDVGGLLYKN